MKIFHSLLFPICVSEHILNIENQKLHVFKYIIVPQRLIKSTIAIWCHKYRILIFYYNTSIKINSRQHSLREEDNFFFFKLKVIIFFKEILLFFVILAASHNVEIHFSSFLGLSFYCYLISKSFESLYSINEIFEKCFVAGHSKIEHSFWMIEAQS